MASSSPIASGHILGLGASDSSPVFTGHLLGLGTSDGSPILFRALGAIGPCASPIFVGPLPGPVVASSVVFLSVLSAARIPLLRLDQARAPLIAVIRSVDMNSTADQPITLGPALYILRRAVITNASMPLSTAVGGVYTGAAKTGTALVSASQVYSGLTASSKFIDATLHVSAGTDAFATGTVFLSLTTPQGVAATADLYLYGDSVEA